MAKSARKTRKTGFGTTTRPPCQNCRKSRQYCCRTTPTCARCEEKSMQCAYDAGISDKVKSRLAASQRSSHCSNGQKQGIREEKRKHVESDGGPFHRQHTLEKRTHDNAKENLASPLTLQDVVSQLPPEKDQLHLARLFFDRVHDPSISFICQNSFTRVLSRGEMSPVLTLAMCAISSRFAGPEGLPTSALLERGDIWAKTSATFTLSGTCPWVQSSFIACLILSLHYRGNGDIRTSNAFTLRAKSMADASAFGGHKDLREWTEQLAKKGWEFEEKHTWAWVCQHRLNQIITLWPSDDIEPPELDGILFLSDEPGMKVLQHIVKLAGVIGNLTDNKTLCYGTGPTISPPTIRRITALASLPTLLQDHKDKKDAEHSMFMHILYEHLIFSMNATYLAKSPYATLRAKDGFETMNEAYTAARGAANRISGLITGAKQNQLAAPLVGYVGTFVAAFLLYDAPDHPESKQAYDRILQYTIWLAQFWKPFQGELKRLQELQQEEIEEQKRKGE